MRVVAGTLGGRKLRSPPSSVTRPTSDRVRESLFATLGPMEGLAVLDLFAGSGALAIEALSRGGASAVLVERDRGAAKVIAANLAALGLAEPQARLIRSTAQQALQQAERAAERYDLIFLDPPYGQPAMLGDNAVNLIVPILALGARVVSESDRRKPFELELPIIDERRYGDTLIRIHKR